MLDNPSDPHPGWSGVKEVYIEAGEEEVQVTLAEVEWEEVRAWDEVTMGRWGGERELESPAGKARGYVGILATHKSNAKRDKICPKGGVKWTSRPGPNELIRFNSIMRNSP